MNKFRRIGAGFCGTVWTPSSDESPYFGFAFKREDGGPERSLHNDSIMHLNVFKACESMPVHIHIPEFVRFITPGDENGWWRDNLKSFPSGYAPCNTIMSERIPSMVQSVRELLIDRYCPAELATEIKCSEANQDCLVRPYLGRRRFNTARPSRFKAFSLRNYPLHLDQFEELGLKANIPVYVEIMAEALAVMHWRAGIDANDVEFVLAPPRSRGSKASLTSNCLGDHAMWILDFDCCRKISFDTDGVDQAVTAFFRNDPFYPRPAICQGLWNIFKRQYIQTSSEILKDISDASVQRLPELFVQRIERGA